jgi:hypothetical protein
MSSGSSNQVKVLSWSIFMHVALELQKAAVVLTHPAIFMTVFAYLRGRRF